MSPFLLYPRTLMDWKTTLCRLSVSSPNFSIVFFFSNMLFLRDVTRKAAYMLRCLLSWPVTRSRKLGCLAGRQRILVKQTTVPFSCSKPAKTISTRPTFWSSAFLPKIYLVVFSIGHGGVCCLFTLLALKLFSPSDLKVLNRKWSVSCFQSVFLFVSLKWFEDIPRTKIWKIWWGWLGTHAQRHLQRGHKWRLIQRNQY